MKKEYGSDNTPAYEIYRLMIDKAYQGKGYGKESLDLLLRYIRTFPYGKAENVYAEWHPENKASEKLFTASGFTVVGADEDGAVTARLNLND